MKKEIIGILGTIVLIIGYFQKDSKKLRIVNNLGAVLFIIYGFLINALSVWLLNMIILGINTYRIAKGD